MSARVSFGGGGAFLGFKTLITRAGCDHRLGRGVRGREHRRRRCVHSLPLTLACGRTPPDQPAHPRSAMFNSGQSCCGIERVYVHESLYDAFVAEVVKVVKVRLPRLGFRFSRL